MSFEPDSTARAAFSARSAPSTLAHCYLNLRSGLSFGEREEVEEEKGPEEDLPEEAAAREQPPESSDVEPDDEDVKSFDLRKKLLPA